ncbi:trichohyalin [Planoprotostelium fungivorum]|uniref:Trichohyalin n=1 Tax=Planoprotostelium fungivorum TaxID=1890364 RepID=A0A2P6NSV5_9EUKA|nr:trichohyalin [Planoprotostelium fungivorum]
MSQTEDTVTPVIEDPADTSISQTDDPSSVSIVTESSAPDTYEGLRQKLADAELKYTKLRTNMAKLKKKMIDTAQMMKLYHAIEKEKNEASSKVTELKKENDSLKGQLEYSLQETKPLREQLTQLEQLRKKEKEELDKARAKSKSQDMLNTQLKVDMDNRIKLFTEKEASLIEQHAKEVARIKERMKQDKKKKDEEERDEDLSDFENALFNDSTTTEPPKKKRKTKKEEKEHVKIEKEQAKMVEDHNKKMQEADKKLNESEKKYQDMEKKYQEAEKKRRELESKLQEMQKKSKEGKKELKELETREEELKKRKREWEAEERTKREERTREDMNRKKEGERQRKLEDELKRREAELEERESLIARQSPPRTEEEPNVIMGPPLRKAIDITSVVHLLTHINQHNSGAVRAELLKTKMKDEMLLFGILRALQSCNTNTLELAVPILVQLLSHRDRSFEETFWLRMSELVVNKEQSIQLSLQHTLLLCEAFSQMCKVKGEVYRVRVLIYDMLREGGFIELQLIAAITSHCREVFSSRDILCQTIQSIFYDHYSTMMKEPVPHDDLIQSFIQLKTNCRWNENALTLEEATNQAVKLLSDRHPNAPLLAMKSLELLSVYRGWSWAHDDLLLQRIWPLLDSASNPPHVVCHAVRLLGLLGRTATSSQQTLPPDVASSYLDLQTRCEALIRQAGQFGLTMMAQINCILSLIDIARDEQLPLVGEWFNSLQPSHKSLLPDHFLQLMLEHSS